MTEKQRLTLDLSLFRIGCLFAALNAGITGWLIWAGKHGEDRHRAMTTTAVMVTSINVVAVLLFLWHLRGRRPPPMD